MWMVFCRLHQLQNKDSVFLYGMELRRVKKCLFAVCCNAVACVNGRQLHATVVAVIMFFYLKVLEVIYSYK